MRRGALAGLLIAGALFIYSLIHLQLVTSSTGDAYPTYSSLRADPMGTKALYDALQDSQSYQVTRSYKSAQALNGSKATILQLWFGVSQWEHTKPGKPESWETLASEGARMVVGVHGLYARGKEPMDPPAVEARIGVRLETPENKRVSVVRKVTGFTLGLADSAWSCLLSTEEGCLAAERQLGKGTLVLLTKPYLLSNEGLSRERDTVLITKLLGERAQEIIFDEANLGLEESGSLMGLVRRYRLVPAVMVLFMLAGLFIWRGSSSLAPVEESMAANLAGRSSVEGLTNLLRRSIAEKELLAVCLTEWKKARTVLSGFQAARLERVEQVAAQGDAPVAIYRAIAKVLRDKS